jgi:hypothetical protein
MSDTLNEPLTFIRLSQQFLQDNSVPFPLQFSIAYNRYNATPYNNKHKDDDGGNDKLTLRILSYSD